MLGHIKIHDYDLIQDISILFEKPIIILGAGHLGSRVCELLQEIPLKVDYIYDANLKEDYYMGIQVVSLIKIKELVREKEYLIIIGTETYRDELLKEIQEKEIQGYICTWHGVQTSIELNIDNVIFGESFRKLFLLRKKMSVNSQFLYSYFSSIKELYEYPQAILVWQPRKVGSITISKMLNEVGVKNIHLHGFVSLRNMMVNIPTFSEQSSKWLKEYYKNDFHKLKIVTLIREPIARSISEFMNCFSQIGVTIQVDKNIVASAEEYVINQLNEDYEFRWFDDEIKEFTGIDIFEYPFNKEEGYVCIRKRNIEILVLKLETLNKNMRVIEEFVGCTQLRCLNENNGTEKYYTYLYEEILKRITLPLDYIEKYYNQNVKFNHFYSTSEKEHFLEKWKRDTKNNDERINGIYRT